MTPPLPSRDAVDDDDDEMPTRAEDDAVTRRVREAATDDPARAVAGDVRALVLAYGQCARGGYLRYGGLLGHATTTPVQTVARGLAEVPPILPTVLRVLSSAADAALRERGLDDDDVDWWLGQQAGRLSYPGHAQGLARQALDIWRGTAPISITVLVNAGPAEAMPEALELLAGLLWHALTGP